MHKPPDTKPQPVSFNAMTTERAKHIIQNLASKGVHFESGLTVDEILKVEATFNFKFPPDLKLLLQTLLPISDEFVNWRLGLESDQERNRINERLNWPLEGLLFDVEKNSFWMKDWGKQPDNYEEQAQIVEKYFYTYPKLIPVYSHRYIPECPSEMGNPIFSVHQMDIIYYGIDLETYFDNEFNYTEPGEYPLLEFPNKKIKFWSEIVESDDFYD